MTGKNVTPERQMAMMRTYLNELKDNTESELYDIKWENLSKPLREKIDSLDRYQVQNDEMINYISANMITTDYLQANYIMATDLYIDATATAKIIKSGHITSDSISVATINAAFQKSQYMEAGKIKADYIDVSAITADFIQVSDLFNTGTTTIAGGHIDTGSISANTITSVISNSTTASFGKLVVDVPPVGNGNSAFKFMLSGNTTANVYLKSFASGQYYLAVNLPY